MSTTVISYAVIGCKIPGKYLFAQEVIKHKHSCSKKAKFCPKCGEEVNLKENVFIGEEDALGDGYHWLGQTQLIFDNSSDFEEWESNAFIGLIVRDYNHSEDASFSLISDLEEIKDKVFKSLAEYRLERYKNTFGLHVFTTYN